MMLEYTDTIKPRISDINYGGHLGHVELVSLLHEVRVNFLNQYSITEVDINGHALIMRSLNLKYKNQAFWGNNLKIKMQMQLEGARIIFNYLVFNSTLENETAIANATMVLLDKKNGKPVNPEIFTRIFKKNDNNTGKYEQ